MLLFGTAVILALTKDVVLGAHTLNVTSLNAGLVKEFGMMDIDGNSLVSEDEMEMFVLKQDTDRDGCISLSEFVRGHGHDNVRFTWALFNHFDHDQNGCVEHADLVGEFDAIDTNPKDGHFTILELEAYNDKLYIQMGIPATN